MLTIFRKEIAVFLNSLIAYLVVLVFLTFIGVFMWLLPETSILDYGYAELDTLFSYGPLAFLLLIPAITMRSFAEEKKDGTIELLLTKPISDWSLLMGKYLSACALVAFSLIPTILYYISVYSLGKPVGNIDSAAVASSYIGLFLLGCVFTSAGIFASAISTNQIVSFILALILCYVTYNGFNHLASLDLWKGSSVSLLPLGLDYHYNALSKGVVDSRNVCYFLTVIGIMLLSTRLVLGSRKW
ncbi:gliding motility-associated ABC transporter permease subunit GldF [uncultured Cytophaga sp.]|uniref:gliding motility-associated ABC transporter permease subunit GldF n=1 Tax=uncultured Cytophaga sp. TaxID=160238 RepID=UPI0026215FCC|nr:gliding motility-associated ABC transporter permease subunit GldF [uncultured Cytophaga sp.]